MYIKLSIASSVSHRHRCKTRVLDLIYSILATDTVLPNRGSNILGYFKPVAIRFEAIR